jgi:hypothetical protein
MIPFMKLHNWTVDLLTEFYPEDKGLLGVNLTRGRAILIRLRQPEDRSLFISYNEIISTALHELCHITFKEHDHDFHALWMQLEDVSGFIGNCRPYRLSPPPEPYLVGDIVIVTDGRKMSLPRADYEKHFSNCWRQTRQAPGCVLPRYFSSCIIARLLYLAKGLDPNQWNDSTLSTQGLRNNYSTAGFNASCALRLCLRMYREGEIVGWHSSTREWLTEVFTSIITWDPRFRDKQFTEPKLQTQDEVTNHLAEAVRYVYRETTPTDKCLRDKVVEMLRDMVKLCQHENPTRFNRDMLNELVTETPDLRSALEEKL